MFLHPLSLDHVVALDSGSRLGYVVMTAYVGKAQHIILPSHYLAQFAELVLVICCKYNVFHN